MYLISETCKPTGVVLDEQDRVDARASQFHYSGLKASSVTPSNKDRSYKNNSRRDCLLLVWLRLNSKLP